MMPLSEDRVGAVREQVTAIVVEMAPISSAGADRTASLVTDLGFDSLKLLELASALEDEFGLAEAAYDDLAEVETVGDAQDLIVQLLAANPTEPSTGKAE